MEQEIGPTALLNPMRRFGVDAAADAQQLSIGPEPVHQRLPTAQQRLVRNLDHRRAVVGLLGGQQPRVNQGVDQLPGWRCLRAGFQGPVSPV